MRRAILAIALLLLGGQTVGAAPFYNSRVSGGGPYGTLTFTGATGVNQILFPDNLSDGLIIGEGANAYVDFRSTNAGEKIFLQKPVTLTSAATFTTGSGAVTFGDDITFSGNTKRLLFPDNTTFSLSEGANPYVTLTSTNGAEMVTITPNLTLSGSTLTIPSNYAATSSGTLSFFIADNVSSGVIFRQSGNTYLQAVTTDGAEKLVTEKQWQFGLLTSISAAGTTQGAATALTHEYNVVTTATTGSADAVKLRTTTSNVGMHSRVKNRSGAATIQLFPESGNSTQICISSGCVAANASVTIANNAELDCIVESTTIVNCR